MLSYNNGSFDLDGAPGNITSGSGGPGIVLKNTNPANDFLSLAGVSEPYSYSMTIDLTMPQTSNGSGAPAYNYTNFVTGFVADNDSGDMDFMELVINDAGSPGGYQIMLIGGQVGASTNVTLFSSISSSPFTIGASDVLSIALGYTSQDGIDWTASGTIKNSTTNTTFWSGPSALTSSVALFQSANPVRYFIGTTTAISPSDDTGDLTGMSGSFSGPVPEPSVPLLVALAAVAGLRHRKRVGSSC